MVHGRPPHRDGTSRREDVVDEESSSDRGSAALDSDRPLVAGGADAAPAAGDVAAGSAAGGDRLQTNLEEVWNIWS